MNLRTDNTDATLRESRHSEVHNDLAREVNDLQRENNTLTERVNALELLVSTLTGQVNALELLVSQP